MFKELVKLTSSKSTGLDNLPARFIKDGANVLKIPITFIVNLSISTFIVPKDMKIARVKPLYKKSSSLEAGNYRPVSILSIVSKILEKSVHSQLVNYLDHNNILYEFQYGFRSKYSTDTCLIHLFDYLKGNTSKGLFTGMPLLDLQKAFDTVDHERGKATKTKIGPVYHGNLKFNIQMNNRPIYHHLDLLYNRWSAFGLYAARIGSYNVQNLCRTAKLRKL